MDIWSSSKRSEVMSRIKSRDTKPELAVRSMLHRLGYRFTVNGPLNRQLPGKPDIVLPRYQTVIFVHGCFWHRHKGCSEATTPKTRAAWWRKKFEGNTTRDNRVARALRRQGWRVVTVWECQIRKNPGGVAARLDRLLRAV